MRDDREEEIQRKLEAHGYVFCWAWTSLYALYRIHPDGYRYYSGEGGGGRTREEALDKLEKFANSLNKSTTLPT